MPAVRPNESIYFGLMRALPPPRVFKYGMICGCSLCLFLSNFHPTRHTTRILERHFDFLYILFLTVLRLLAPRVFVFIHLSRPQNSPVFFLILVATPPFWSPLLFPSPRPTIFVPAMRGAIISCIFHLIFFWIYYRGIQHTGRTFFSATLCPDFFIFFFSQQKCGEVSPACFCYFAVLFAGGSTAAHHHRHIRHKTGTPPRRKINTAQETQLLVIVFLPPDDET